MVVLALQMVWLLLHPIGATLVPEAMNLPDHLAVFCPDVDVCPERNITDRNYTRQTFRGRVACCTECSCDDACVHTNNCCFPPTDLHPDSKCLYPTTQPSAKEKPLLYKSYRMIDNDASKISVGNTSDTSCLQNAEKIPCGEISHPPFGNLFPVYSKHLNKIYKNPACATSHEVNDGVPWQPRIICETPASPQASANIQTLEYGIIPDACYIDFVYPGNETDLDTHVCYRDMTHTCGKDSFPIPERLNISATQVRALCQSGFTSPGRIHDILYANVFCHICTNTRRRLYTDTSKYCTQYERQRHERNGLSYLLNIDDFSTAGFKSKATIPEVCDGRQGIMNSSSCRELKCPINQIRDQNGNCHFMVYNNEVTNNYLMYLRVYIDGFKISANDDFKESMDELIRLWNKVNPWPKQGNLFCELDHQNYTNPQVNSLLVGVLVSPARNTPFQTFIRNIKAYLNKIWVLKVKGSSIKVRPSFSEYSSVSQINANEVTIYGYPKCLPRSIIYMNPDDLLSLNVTTPLILLLHVSILHLQRVPSISYLTKLYYCEQIELQPHEFIAYKAVSFNNIINAQALYNKLTGRLMLENEFWLVSIPNSENIVARICLSDSGFKKKAIQTSGAGPMDVCMVLVMTFVWSSLHMFGFRTPLLNGMAYFE